MRSGVEREFEFTVPAPIDQVADLLSDVRQLNRLTPGWFDMQVDGDKRPIIRQGTEIDYRLTWRGLARRWRSRIVEWRPPHFFAYEQVEGPFDYFHHEHILFEIEEGTRVLDHVSYRSPGGRWVDRWLVGPDLERIFAYRAQATRRELVDSVGRLGGAGEVHPLDDGFQLAHRPTDTEIAGGTQT